MSEPRTVFAVCYGSYSDYRVHCLFTTEELAKAYAEGDAEAVEEFTLWDRLPEKFDTYEIYARVLPDGIYSDGPYAQRLPPEIKHIQLDETSPTGREHRVYIDERSYNYGGQVSWFVQVKGTDRDRVQKDFDAAVIEARIRLAKEPSNV